MQLEANLDSKESNHIKYTAPIHIELQENTW
jgi:hypothetical protein